MKKWIVVLLILSIIVYVFYMRYTHEVFFNKLTQNQDYFEEVEFQKGFLVSQASFILKNKSYPKIRLQARLKLYNHPFSKQGIKGELRSDYGVFKKDLLARFSIDKIEDDNVVVFLEFENINLEDQGGNTTLNGAKAQVLLNKNLEVKNIKIHFKNMVFSQFYTQFSLENLNYVQDFDIFQKWYEFDLLNPGKQEISFDHLSFNHNKINSFHSQNDLKIKQNSLDIKIQGRSNEIDIYLKDLLDQNLNFEKSRFNIRIYKDLEFDILHFFEKNLEFKIEDLDFEKNNQKIKTQGDIKIKNKTYEAKLQISTLNKPDDIFPWTKSYGGINQYFVKQNHAFVLHVLYDNKARLKLNGKEFSNKGKDK
ncbi:YdgA family protein [Campylobacter sp. VicNov18]|uniref:hypothetical protein n=1 Tax=Campylobacter bilis TaxID=2691918 RepID=UPI00130D68F3|nr:hypothetical protein [Campylobacter bilis]MPV62966.1 hypothetical protein [Campylobacter hepaticus]MBM0636465.1 hypothetical protein [Campylobacter bilis]MCC8277174.1 YdgA family protein [Campylobacter bilis]MCC8298917.1 YdgA family protein [Campylobacter bilis]MCC8300083.1 YdgA family protein [Campylobacter bilis]